MELATTGIEIGIELDQTAEGVKARFKPGDADPTALERLWELGDCATLLELSRATLALKGGEETPALLFEGVGLWEAGQYEPGLERVKAYLTRFGKNWTMNFSVDRASTTWASRSCARGARRRVSSGCSAPSPTTRSRAPRT